MSVSICDSVHTLLGRSDGTLREMLDARARRDPDKTFIIFDGRSWSYADALIEVRASAGRLTRLARMHDDSPPADRPVIASYLPNRIETMWVFLGALYAGLPYCPLNRGHKGDLLRNWLGMCGARILITDQGALDDGVSASATSDMVVVTIDHKVDQNRLADSFFDIEPDNELGPAPSPLSPATFMFTSGTTGRSKIIVVAQNQYCRGAGRIVDGYGLTEADVFHNWLPLFHLAGQLHMTATAILCGGTVALQPTFSRSAFWNEVESTGASVLCGFAAILHFIWSLPERPGDSRSTLRVGIFAGIPKDLHAPFEARFGMLLGENYGMTEADPITLPGPTPWRHGTSGLPAPDFEVETRDEAGRKPPPGVHGEIYYRARVPGVRLLGRLTEKGLESIAYTDWLGTGDLGVLDAEGYLHFRGRKSAYIRRRGENVSVAELEALLIEAEGVAECVVVGVPSNLGEDDIKAVLVAHSGCVPDAAALHRWARARMAGFMVPRYYEYVSELPRTDLGKVALADLKTLSDSVWDAESQPLS
ncbi:class I adenylate-forming enzyme family protein [Hyphomonas sp.]|uniref:class I adenylate-forming enzyme family protein n=1 Tax=Hyphomonas sp. TaxID=87 RepID=UPI00391A7453